MKVASTTFAILLGGLLLLPLIALLLASSPTAVASAVEHPSFAPALWLSLKTTILSLFIIVVCGTPLAWWLSKAKGAWPKAASVIVDLPIIMPPAVVGVALLKTFGREGTFGPMLDAAGINIPFTTAAVVIAQVVVASPFFIQAAANAFRKVDEDTLIVARSLGATPAQSVMKVAIPVALPGLVAGASLAWARALGEFGATLLFAGNMPGTTQTMPLAIFNALESDVDLAVVMSLVLVAIGALLLVTLRLGPILRRSS